MSTESRAAIIADLVFRLDGGNGSTMGMPMKTTKKAFFKLLQKAATTIAPSTAPKSTKSGCCTGKKTRSRNPSSKCRQGIIAFIDTGDTMKLFLICSAIQVSAVGTTEGHEPNIQPQVVMSLPSDGCALQPVANREQISK